MTTVGVAREKVRPAACVAASFHDDAIVFFHKVDGRVFTSNQVGQKIWQGLERCLSIGAIAHDLSREYAIPDATAREHADRFLGELERWGLVERSAE